MGWAVCTPTVIYNAFRLQKRPKKSHSKDYGTGSLTAALPTATPGAPCAPGQPASENLSLSLSTDDSGSGSGSENSSSVFTQDEDMQFRMEMMDQREQRCPCGCPGQNFHDGRESVRIRTKEVLNRSGPDSLPVSAPAPAAAAAAAPALDTTDRIFGFEVLRHQGRHYCPEDIASVWKKDCRMWLWKSKEKTRRPAGGKDQRCS